MRKLIFFDIDWTLLDHRTGQVPASAIQAIQQARQAGSRCFLCTGRNYIQLKSFPDYGMAGSIFSLGAGIEIDGRILYQAAMPQAAALQTLAYCSRYGIGCAMDTLQGAWADQIYYDRFMKSDWLTGLNDEEKKKQAHRLGVHSAADFDGIGVTKINFLSPNRETEQQLQKNLDPLLRYVPNRRKYPDGSIAAEACLKDVSKGNAVKMICRHYGVQPADTYGFGDSMNDMELLQACGTGIAMGNAVDELKQAADYVTSPIDADGIMNGMHHFHLI